MRSRAYRGTQGNRRKAIGAVVIGGVLVAAGLTGVQLASASTTPTAADVVTVDGQQFDVSKCEKLEVNGGDVVCDGEKLAPEQAQGAQDANQAALASAQALEAACDTFAADAAAADGQNAGDQNGEDQNADQNAGDQNADQKGEGQAAGKENSAKSKAEIKKAAKKWAKAMKAADKRKAEAGANKDENAGAAEDQNAEDQNAEDQNAEQQGDAAADAAAAVSTAQGGLLQACLTLAQIKAVAGVGAADNGDQQAGQEQGANEKGNADEQGADKQGANENGNADEQANENAKAKN